MYLPILDALGDLASGINFTLPAQAALSTGLLSNPNVLVAGIVLIIVSAVIFFLLRKVIEHVILGGIAWALTIFVFHIPLPVIPSLIIAIIFGPAGIGVMLILKFFGLV